MYDEDELLPIAAVQQLAYCERRCALMYLEGQWEENRFTVEGLQLHDRAHELDVEMRGDLRTCRGLRLRSLRLGLVGVADVVEFRRVSSDSGEEAAEVVSWGVALPGQAGRWQPFPVEYKRGRPKPDHSDEVQLCAQALCLEEMLNCAVPTGAMFYGQPRRRYEVSFDAALREETTRLALHLHRLVASGRTPPAGYEKKCRGCSLESQCLPRLTGAGRSAAHYTSQALEAALREEASD